MSAPRCGDLVIGIDDDNDADEADDDDSSDSNDNNDRHHVRRFEVDTLLSCKGGQRSVWWEFIGSF